MYHSFPAQLPFKHKEIISKRIIFMCVLLFLLQGICNSHGHFLKPFLITTRDNISSDADSCLFPGVPEKRPDSFWVSWVSVRFSLKTPECTAHLLKLVWRVWGIRVPQSLCTYVLGRRKRHKLVFPPKTAWRVNASMSFDSWEQTQEKVGGDNAGNAESWWSVFSW